MTDEIQVWAIDELAGSAKITGVEPTGQTATENLLEEVLVEAPDMLIPTLRLWAARRRSRGIPVSARCGQRRPARRVGVETGKAHEGGDYPGH